ncbi:MAG: rhodanese-like domain-containing protein [Candidatus Aminicenantales bacterium]
MILTKRFWWEAGLVVGLGAAVGLAVNVRLIREYFKGGLNPAFISERAYPGAVLISLPEAEDLFAGGQGVFVDARSVAEFQAGHIAGAMSMPYEEILKAEPERFVAALPPGKMPVVYCSGGDCLTSLALAKLFAEHGAGEIRVFQGGWAEWSAAGLPTEKVDDPE